METAFVIVLVLAVLLLLAAVAVVVARRSHAPAGRMRERFGPEFDFVTSRLGSEDAAARELRRREKRVRRYRIQKLEPAQRDAFYGEWLSVQGMFVDDPTAAVSAAESLLHRVMEERGYPVRDFERNAEDLSVDHPRFVDSYREAHGIALATREDRASTEDLRRAVVLYRDMFEDLLVA